MEESMKKLLVSNPAVKEIEWCKKYAKGLLRIYGAGDNPEDYKKVLSTIEKTFLTVYRAIAFDIDGTLTSEDSDSIDEQMGRIIGELLRRSVPILLITGRGRGSTKKAAQDILYISNLSYWYARRLQCITHNGAFLLNSPSTHAGAFMSREIQLTEGIPGISDLKEFLYREVDIIRNYKKIEITEEPLSLRISCDRECEIAEKLTKEINRKIRTNVKYKNLFISRGSYRNLNCIDISTTNKMLALKYYANQLGVGIERILRIGDQGHEEGNCLASPGIGQPPV